MIHKHTHDHHDHFSDDEKHGRLKSRHPVDSIKDFDDSQPESETLQPTRNRSASGMLSNQQRLELSQAAERNKQFLNPIQSVWPTR